MGGIGKIAGGLIKQVAPAVIKAVAPAATKLLKGITDGFISTGANALKGLTSNLPSPIAKLADKLIGKGADFLKNLAGGGIEKGLQKLTELVTKRFLPGVGNVSVPGMSTPERQAAIQNNTPATGSSSSAATGSAGSSSAPSASASGITSPPDPKNYGDLQDQNNMQRLLKDQQAYQTNFSAMQNYWSMISNIMKANFQTLQGMAQNLR